MKRKPYPSDLTDAQRRLIAPLIPAVKPGGRPRKYEMLEVMDALLYVDREGCSWRALPHDFPHWKTCYNFFRRFEADGTWDSLVAALRVPLRKKLGREPTPSGAFIDALPVNSDCSNRREPCPWEDEMREDDRQRNRVERTFAEAERFRHCATMPELEGVTNSTPQGWARRCGA